MRALRSFSRHRWMSVTICAGTSAGSADQFGVVFMTAAIISVASSPSNARAPVSISYSTAPKAQTSVRLSTARPRACSGDMYAAVPRITPVPGHQRGARQGRDVRGRPVPAVRGPASDELRQPEIQHLHGAVGSHLDVGGLEIAMDDPLLVRRFERFRDLPRDRQRLIDRDRSMRDAVGERRPSTSSITSALTPSASSSSP